MNRHKRRASPLRPIRNTSSAIFPCRGTYWCLSFVSTVWCRYSDIARQVGDQYTTWPGTSVGLSDECQPVIDTTGTALAENNESPHSLPLQMAERLLGAQPDSATNRLISDRRASMWLATEIGWARSKRSAICSGKLISGYTWFHTTWIGGTVSRIYICRKYMYRSVTDTISHVVPWLVWVTDHSPLSVFGRGTRCQLHCVWTVGWHTLWTHGCRSGFLKARFLRDFFYKKNSKVQILVLKCFKGKPLNKSRF